MLSVLYAARCALLFLVPAWLMGPPAAAVVNTPLHPMAEIPSSGETATCT